jgi:hypothetical protein
LRRKSVCSQQRANTLQLAVSSTKPVAAGVRFLMLSISQDALRVERNGPVDNSDNPDDGEIVKPKRPSRRKYEDVLEYIRNKPPLISDEAWERYFRKSDRAPSP